MSAPDRVTVTGRLTADAVEGGSPHLVTADGRRYAVIWPAGWHLRRSDFTLRDSSGVVVARGGEHVAVHGVLADRLASFRQSGRVLRAEVVTRDEPDASVRGVDGE
jgi:hypothetical protein